MDSENVIPVEDSATSADPVTGAVDVAGTLALVEAVHETVADTQRLEGELSALMGAVNATQESVAALGSTIDSLRADIASLRAQNEIENAIDDAIDDAIEESESEPKVLVTEKIPEETKSTVDTEIPLARAGKKRRFI